MGKPQYFFSQGAFLCVTGGFVFILDLKRNKYECLTESNFKSVSNYIAAQAESPHSFDSYENECHSYVLSLLADFMNRGILTTDPEQAQIPDATPIACPTTSLIDVARLAERPTLIQLISFARAAFHAHACLKRRTLESIVQRIKLRKQFNLISGEPFDYKEAARVLSVFGTLRPLFPRSYLCIYDSLALLEFFAIHGLFPTWVFGIQAEPFEAHCWLQQEKVVINDDIYRVKKFNPIMTV
jgi:hypothetical protein